MAAASRPPDRARPVRRALVAVAVIGLVLTAVVLIAQPRRLTLSEGAIATVFGALGLMHLRETPLVLMATAPMVATRLAALTSRGLDYRAIAAGELAARQGLENKIRDQPVPEKGDFFGLGIHPDDLPGMEA